MIAADKVATLSDTETAVFLDAVENSTHRVIHEEDDYQLLNKEGFALRHLTKEQRFRTLDALLTHIDDQVETLEERQRGREDEEDEDIAHSDVREEALDVDALFSTLIDR